MRHANILTQITQPCLAGTASPPGQDALALRHRALSRVRGVARPEVVPGLGEGAFDVSPDPSQTLTLAKRLRDGRTESGVSLFGMGSCDVCRVPRKSHMLHYRKVLKKERHSAEYPADKLLKVPQSPTRASCVAQCCPFRRRRRTQGSPRRRSGRRRGGRISAARR